MADFTNAVQALAESQRLGIPVLFKDNARNHYDTDPRFGISGGAGAFTEFPKEAGVAAAALGAGDVSPVKALAEVMGREWRAIGLRGMYGYTADLATEPRWYRVQETFTEDADLGAEIMKTLVLGLQGGPVSPSTAVALTLKHFPGGGPQALGLDPHYSFGKRQIYPGGRFEYHLRPFKVAIDAGVSSIMPYYGVPIGVTYHLSFTTMAGSQSWRVTPALADIQAVMREVGASKTVLAIYFRNPYVLDDESRLTDAGAILATFGVSDTAILEVLSGRFKPRGKLPFALARTLQAVVDNEPDVPGYPFDATLYPLKFGLTFWFRIQRGLRWGSQECASTRPARRMRFADLLELDRVRLRAWMFTRAAAEPRNDWSDGWLFDLARRLTP